MEISDTDSDSSCCCGFEFGFGIGFELGEVCEGVHGDMKRIRRWWK